MWIASTKGFFSIVEKHPGEFQIRARERGDLDNLKTTVHSLCNEAIIETPKADYRYRMVINRAQVMDTVTTLAMAIDYSNFKNAVHATPGQENKSRPYMTVWSALGAVQPGGPYGRAERRQPLIDRARAEQYRTGELPLRTDLGSPDCEHHSAPRDPNKPNMKGPEHQTKWAIGNDGHQHAVACKSKRTVVGAGRGRQGIALCHAESDDWKKPTGTEPQCEACARMRKYAPPNGGRKPE